MAPVFALLFILAARQTDALFQITPGQWGTLVLITFSTGLVALGFYYFGLKKTPARITTLCELVWPASAILIDYFFYHKTLSWTQMLGIGLLSFAIYQVTRSSEKHQLRLP